MSGRKIISSHQPVMAEQVTGLLRPPKNSLIVDATVGLGGHAEALLNSAADSILLGIDRDVEALEIARERLKPFGTRVILAQGKFSELGNIMREHQMQAADTILFDFGCSSPQLDQPERGFSYRRNGPLDMRMNQSQTVTAAMILNQYSEEELCRIFRQYGEEPRARQMARAVVERRRYQPWSHTLELAELADKYAAKKRGRGSEGPPAPTRCFQALRVAVNDELHEIEEGLRVALENLRTGGRLAAISFHSLEDRIVKNFFREAARECICPPDFPECRCEKKAIVKILTKRPLRPEPTEIEENRRSAPSRLRVVEKIPVKE